jgi:hypothetical protein
MNKNQMYEERGMIALEKKNIIVKNVMQWACQCFPLSGCDQNLKKYNSVDKYHMTLVGEFEELYEKYLRNV